jgi:hypothetical protein
MATIALLNMENKYKNLAIEKIRLFYQEKGDEVVDYFPLWDNKYDKVYVSSIFAFTPKKYIPTNAIVGGSGFDLKTCLPEEIEEIKPKLNFGFTTRGCIRKCPFCVVPEKEGNLRVVGDIYDIWDGTSTSITLLDNNILGLPEHFYKIANQLIDNSIKVDFNQGLDIRLVTEDIAKMLSQISHVEYRFAFDWPGMATLIQEKIEMLKHYGINRSMFYVLVGFNTSIEEDMKRLNLLRTLKQNAYVMRYKKEKKYIEMARWANQHHIFQGMTFEEFLKKRKLPVNYVEKFLHDDMMKNNLILMGVSDYD